jgi:predicted metal-dependent hydrolase
MADEQHTIQGPDGGSIAVRVRRDRRLKKSARLERDGSEYILRVPYRLPRREVNRLLADIPAQLAQSQERAANRTDDDLQARAEYINEKYFQGAVEWAAIRWVGNMRTRLGSCTSGGSTDGHIRISERIKGWPEWVIDYVIAHELAHRVHANHSRAFWDYLTGAYPLTERARGFIQGVGFAAGEPLAEDDAS